MRIFKFGGASVKDAEGVRNLVKVLEQTGADQLLLVVSAMGKTTNAMEKVVDAYFEGKNSIEAPLNEVRQYHTGILRELFPDSGHSIYKQVDALFDEILGFIAWNKSPKYNFVYDQIVAYGELLATTIVSAYLRECKIRNTWLDIRQCIKTDSNYRVAEVNWGRTEQNLNRVIEKNTLYVTQGFIASDDNNFTTTLGREGSDYTAAILAYCLDAGAVTIWKDVPGVLNADPRYFDAPELLEKISYREAIELAFYGASVIHPKTLQPLQRKEIPLLVKSFKNPEGLGTTVGKGVPIEPEVPCFILKKNQVLLKFSSLDFSFIVERNISDLFKHLHDHKMKVDLIQNSAISFSVCVDNTFNNLGALLAEVEGRYKIECYEGVSLYTVRHFTLEALESLYNGREVLLEQRGRETVQIVVKQ